MLPHTMEKLLFFQSKEWGSKIFSSHS